MAARSNIRQHATLVYPIDELCLGAAPNAHGRSLELCVYAYGEAEVAFDRDGDWEIVGLRIDGHRESDVRSRTWLRETAELPREHALYPVIVEALHALSFADIGDRVADVLQRELEAA
jgi:hypothetical protein